MGHLIRKEVILTLALTSLLQLSGAMPQSEVLGSHQNKDKPDEPHRVNPDIVLRPLENMADRFLRSETMDVFDSLTARTIEGLARFVDDAGLAVMSIVDRLPQTIDRVADTVDDVVKNADNLGREVAVIVTAPARVVMAGLNPDSRYRLTDPVEPIVALDSPAPNLHKDIISGGEDLSDSTIVEVVVDSDRIPESIYDKAITDTNMIKGSSDDVRRNWEGGEDLERGTRSSSQQNKIPINGQPEKPTAVKQVNNKDTRRRRPISEFLGSLGIHFNRRNRNKESNKQRPNTDDNDNKNDENNDERPQNVFERNFENSRTQQSIQKLEEEIGGFLGRLLGTVYRNADNIDTSLSQGIRRFVGDSSEIVDVPVTVSPVKSKPTTTEFAFRLNFDDIDPAPIKNSALQLP